jgi:hypothetical protein
MGNGRFQRTPRYSTRTKYRTVSKTRQVPRYVTKTRQVAYKEAIYRQDPIYRTFYTYQVNRWKNVAPRITKGQDTNPVWPSTEIKDDIPGIQIGDYKLGGRDDAYTIAIITQDEEAKTYTTDFNLNRWASLKDGQILLARIRLGRIEKLMTLEEAENE